MLTLQIQWYLHFCRIERTWWPQQALKHMTQPAQEDTYTHTRSQYSKALELSVSKHDSPSIIYPHIWNIDVLAWYILKMKEFFNRKVNTREVENSRAASSTGSFTVCMHSQLSSLLMQTLKLHTLPLSFTLHLLPRSFLLPALKFRIDAVGLYV